MKRLGLITILLFSLSPMLTKAGTAHSSKPGRNPVTTKLAGNKFSKKGFTVTLTTYWAVGRGSDYWTRRFTSSTGQRLIDGVTVAADPKVIPYGSIIDIEGVGRRIVKDTGSHVVQRVASRRRGVNYPVIDLFFASRQDALVFARNHGPFAEVRIISREV